MARHKDIQFSSRAGPTIVRLQKIRRLRRALRKLMEHWPKGEPKECIPEWRELEAEACDSTMHVVRLLAPAGAGEDALKDVDFSRVGSAVAGRPAMRTRCGSSSVRRGRIRPIPWRG
jgi:NTE family protein